MIPAFVFHGIFVASQSLHRQYMWQQKAADANMFFSQEISFKSLLEEIISYDAIARWPQPGFVLKQASSYDRRSVSPNKPGWFANTDQAQFIRTEENGSRKENVMSTLR